MVYDTPYYVWCMIHLVIWSNGKDHKVYQYTDIIGCIIDTSFSHSPAPNSIKLPSPSLNSWSELASTSASRRNHAGVHLRWCFTVVAAVPAQVRSRGASLRDGMVWLAVTAARYGFETEVTMVLHCGLRRFVEGWLTSSDGGATELNDREWWWSLTVMVTVLMLLLRCHSPLALMPLLLGHVHSGCR